MARNIFENDVISNSFNSMVGVVSKEIGAINNFLSSFQIGQQN